MASIEVNAIPSTKSYCFSDLSLCLPHLQYVSQTCHTASVVKSGVSPPREYILIFIGHRAHNVATFGSTKLFTSVPSFHSQRGRRRLLNREREEKEDMRRGKRDEKERIAKTKNGEEKTKRKTRREEDRGKSKRKTKIYPRRDRKGKRKSGEE